MLMGIGNSFNAEPTTERTLDMSWTTSGQYVIWLVSTKSLGRPIEINEGGWAKLLPDNDLFITEGNIIVQVFTKIVGPSDVSSPVIFSGMNPTTRSILGISWNGTTTVDLVNTVKDDSGSTLLVPGWANNSYTWFQGFSISKDPEVSPLISGWGEALSFPGGQLSMSAYHVQSTGHTTGTPVTWTGLGSLRDQGGVMLGIA